MGANRPGPGCGRHGRALWVHATARQRTSALVGGAVLVLGVGLASLDPAALPVVLALLVLDAVLLAQLRTSLLRRCREERRISDEAARGQRQLERWLSFGELA